MLALNNVERQPTATGEGIGGLGTYSLEDTQIL